MQYYPLAALQEGIHYLIQALPSQVKFLIQMNKPAIADYLMKEISKAVKQTHF